VSFDQTIENARNGSLALQLDPEQFDQILKACDVYIDALTSLKTDAERLGQRKLGFAEDHLDSGAQLAQKFQRKAAGGSSSASSTFQSHIERVQEMKALFLALRSGYQNTDQSIADNLDPHGR
jgi:hypothetical protein